MRRLLQPEQDAPKPGNREIYIAATLPFWQKTTCHFGSPHRARPRFLPFRQFLPWHARCTDMHRSHKGAPNQNHQNEDCQIPWNDIDVLANRMNRLFSDSGLGNLTYASNWVPPVSVEERGGEILLTAELPGMAADAVEIDLENNVLTISGEKHESREEGEQGGKYHLVERSFGSFRRSFTLPRTVRADGITADFENGLLTVRLPKAEEAVSRKIEVSRRN